MSTEFSTVAQPALPRSIPTPDSTGLQSFMDNLAPDLMRLRWFKGPATRWDYALTRRCLMEALAPSPADRVLEIGCGPGTWTGEVAARCRGLVAVDLSARMIAEARKQVTDLPVQFIHSDFLESSPDGKFDKVFSVRAMEYIGDKERLASKIAGLLAPGGRVILITKSRFSIWRGRNRLVYAQWPGNPFKKSVNRAALRRSGFFQSFTSPADITRMFAPHGIVPVRIRPVVLRLPLFRNGFDEVPLVPDMLAAPVLAPSTCLWHAASRLPSWLSFLPLFFSESYCITLQSVGNGVSSPGARGRPGN